MTRLCSSAHLTDTTKIVASKHDFTKTPPETELVSDLCRMQDLGADVSEKKHKGLCGKAVIGGQKCILLKPQTYMNSSGESIRAAADYFKIAPEDIIIIYDDISLAPGQLRVRAKGSAGGHNGIKSIIAHLGTQEFPRVRVGVGEKPSRMDLADYVLGHFSAEDRKIMAEAVKEAADAACEIIESGIEHAMNAHNKKKA
ncbi:MAG: aminoacyl-tRNA hydrolase [Lachnospiraceae bacterium]|nr:aminoacyl-tRNA hydrolase [Lachnospiraceae bacterium]